MKKFLFILTAIISYSLIACSEDEIKTYDGEDFIYFSYRMANNNHDIWWDSLTTFNFFFTTKDDTLISIPVTAGGKMSDKDRVFLVETEVEGEGIEGLDFELDPQQIMPAGKNKVNVKLKLMRRAEMEGQTYRVIVKLKANENFTTNLPWGIDSNSDTLSRLQRIVECQAELTEPAYYTSNKSWGLGYWSVLKFNTMNEYWGTTIEDWLDSKSNLRTNLNNYMIVFANYLNRQASLGADAAIKDPCALSERGYMTMDGYAYFGVAKTVIPANFPTTAEWEGNQ